MRSVVGKWKGFYEFGAGYPLPYFAGRVEFEWLLTGTNDKLLGSCTDTESEISMHMKSIIEGYAEEHYISLRKTYEHSVMIEENGELKVDLNKEMVLF